jgi:hypothetical protein
MSRDTFVDYFAPQASIKRELRIPDSLSVNSVGNERDMTVQSLGSDYSTPFHIFRFLPHLPVNTTENSNPTPHDMSHDSTSPSDIVHRIPQVWMHLASLEACCTTAAATLDTAAVIKELGIVLTSTGANKISA